MTNKVVINICYGGFSLSREAIIRAREISGNSSWGGPSIVGDVYNNGEKVKFHAGFLHDVARHDPILVQVVEELGERANGSAAMLDVVTPTSNVYRIDEYDGMESLETPNSYDWVIIKNN